MSQRWRMADTRYRSYLVRAWAASGATGTDDRVVVEEVRSGRQAEVRGAPAIGVSRCLEAVLEGSTAGQEGERRMILVVGATGLVGGEICRRLAARGQPVRALVRETSQPDKVAALRALGAEIATGSLQDQASLAAACKGVSAVITTVSSMPFSYVPGVNDIRTTDTDGVKRLVDSARDAGVPHFVYTSFSSNLDVDTPLRTAKRSVEEHLIGSGMGYTILRPSCFMEVWLSPAVGFDPAGARATVYGTGTAPISWIAIADVAELAIQSLEAPAARNAALELGGPEALSALEVIDIFERLAGRPFEVVHVPIEALAAQQEAATDPMAQTFAGLMRCVALGDRIDMAPLLQEIPLHMTTVREFAAAAVGAPSAVAG
jgi:uncharacterized protein YbjT (DUF2867 family)